MVFVAERVDPYVMQKAEKAVPKKKKASSVAKVKKYCTHCNKSSHNTDECRLLKHKKADYQRTAHKKSMQESKGKSSTIVKNFSDKEINMFQHFLAFQAKREAESNSMEVDATKDCTLTAEEMSYLKSMEHEDFDLADVGKELDLIQDE